LQKWALLELNGPTTSLRATVGELQSTTIAAKLMTNAIKKTIGRIQNTLFFSQLINGPNKPECYLGLET